MRRRPFLRLMLCAVAVVIVALAIVLGRRPPVRYKLTLLPSLGGFRTDAHSINDRGQVVGIAQTPTDAVHIFLWDHETGLQSLGRFDDPPHAGGLYINNAGQVAGTVYDPNGNRRAFLWDPNTGKRQLGTLGGKQSITQGINNKGHIVGRAETPERFLHAFIWDPVHGMHDLGTLGGPISAALGVNDMGQVGGFAETADRRTRIVLWDPNSTTEQGQPPVDAVVRSQVPGSSGTPAPAYRTIDLGDAGLGPFTCDINNRRLVVWRLGTKTGKTYFYTWTKATGSRKLDFVAINLGISCGLNDANQFLVYAKPAGLEVFNHVLGRRHESHLWDPDAGPLRLADCLPERDIVHFTVRDLNNHGAIVGMLRTKDSNQVRAVLLEPVENAR